VEALWNDVKYALRMLRRSPRAAEVCIPISDAHRLPLHAFLECSMQKVSHVTSALFLVAVLTACGGRGGMTPTAPSAPPATLQPFPSPAPPIGIPAAPFQLSVWVMNTTGGPCSGCFVEIASSPGAGASATTPGAPGSAVFNIPFPGALTLRASKEGYRLVQSTVTVDGMRQTTFHSMMIESVLPPVDLSGVRVLELRADAACSQLPSERRTRTYAVSAVRLDEGYRPYKFYPANGVFNDFLVWAYVSGNDTAINIVNWENEQEAAIVEPLPSGNVLRIRAWTGVFAVSNPDSISTTMEGTISYCDASSKCSAVCNSKNHEVTLSRR
jgi:hypothetical protein